MPLAGINWVVVNAQWYAKGQTAVGAARKHYVSRAASGRHDASQHVNVIVGRASGTINRQKQLAPQSSGIYTAEAPQDATHVDRGHLVKGRCLVPELGVT